MLGSKYLVASTWYQVLGSKYLVPRSRYQVLGTKFLVPSFRYHDSVPSPVSKLVSGRVLVRSRLVLVGFLVVGPEHHANMPFLTLEGSH